MLTWIRTEAVQEQQGNLQSQIQEAQLSFWFCLICLYARFKSVRARCSPDTRPQQQMHLPTQHYCCFGQASIALDLQTWQYLAIPKTFNNQGKV
jgi:hypothetical protein